MPVPHTSAHALDPRRGLRRTAAWLIGLCGVYQVAIGLYFIALRPAMLPEDARFLETSITRLHADLPRLEIWLHLVFVVLGGQMAAVGVLVVGSSLRILQAQLRSRGEVAWLGAAGVLSVGTMAGVNFVLKSDFRWLLIAPGLAWSVGLVLALASYRTNWAANRHGKE